MDRQLAVVGPPLVPPAEDRRRRRLPRLQRRPHQRPPRRDVGRLRRSRAPVRGRHPRRRPPVDGSFLLPLLLSLSLSRYKVRLGVHRWDPINDSRIDDDDDDVFGIGHIVAHESYKAKTSQNDVAILYLSRTVVFTGTSFDFSDDFHYSSSFSLLRFRRSENPNDLPAPRSFLPRKR